MDAQIIPHLPALQFGFQASRSQTSPLPLKRWHFHATLNSINV